jgi:hypothetical protein
MKENIHFAGEIAQHCSPHNLATKIKKYIRKSRDAQVLGSILSPMIEFLGIDQFIELIKYRSRHF